jgi:hypothetical protein
MTNEDFFVKLQWILQYRLEVSENPRDNYTGRYQFYSIKRDGSLVDHAILPRVGLTPETADVYIDLCARLFRMEKKE